MKKMISEDTLKVINSFPTKSDSILQKNSYFYVVYSRLLKASKFLEIGYRKGLFVEVAKSENVPSVHVDIVDDLLKATPTDENRCYTSDSVAFLEKCNEDFDLIFQDGSKLYKDRKLEYDLIMKRNILRKSGTIIVDDLHYDECQKAFDYAKEKYKFSAKVKIVKDKRPYRIGILTLEN